MNLFPTDTGATFSECRTYRYRLWRRWDEGPTAMFLLLNPSSATDVTNDATVERCQRRSARMGYGALFVGNIFALRSTDPKGLYAIDDPTGPENDEHILAMARESGLVICGWGNHGTLNGRGQRVMQMIREIGVEPHVLRVTGAGQPGHPLYIGYDTQPRPLAELQEEQKR